MRAIALLAFLLLASCGGTPAQPYLHVCPQIVDYPRSMQTQALDDLSRLPQGSPARKMFNDYLALRDETRACQKGG